MSKIRSLIRERLAAGTPFDQIDAELEPLRRKARERHQREYSWRPPNISESRETIRKMLRLVEALDWLREHDDPRADQVAEMLNITRNRKGRSVNAAYEFLWGNPNKTGLYAKIDRVIKEKAKLASILLDCTLAEIVERALERYLTQIFGEERGDEKQ